MGPCQQVAGLGHHRLWINLRKGIRSCSVLISIFFFSLNSHFPRIPRAVWACQQLAGRGNTGSYSAEEKITSRGDGKSKVIAEGKLKNIGIQFQISQGLLNATFEYLRDVCDEHVCDWIILTFGETFCFDNQTPKSCLRMQQFISSPELKAHKVSL